MITLIVYTSWVHPDCVPHSLHPHVPHKFLPHPAEFKASTQFARSTGGPSGRGTGCMDQFDLDVKDCCSSVARSKHLRLEEMGRLKAMSSFWVKHGAGMEDDLEPLHFGEQAVSSFNWTFLLNHGTRWWVNPSDWMPRHRSAESRIRRFHAKRESTKKLSASDGKRNKLFVFAHIFLHVSQAWKKCYNRKMKWMWLHTRIILWYMNMNTWSDHSEDEMWKPLLNTNVFAGRLMPYLQPRWDNQCRAKGASGRTKITWFRIAAIAATTGRTTTSRGLVGDFWCCRTASLTKVKGLGARLVLMPTTSCFMMWAHVFMRIW